MNGTHTHTHTQKHHVQSSSSDWSSDSTSWHYCQSSLMVNQGIFHWLWSTSSFFSPSRGDETLPARETLFPLSLLSRTDNWAQITVLSGSSAHSLASPPLSASRVATEQVSCHFHVIYHLKQSLNSAECAQWWINRLFLQSWKMRIFFLLCQAVETS